MVIASSIDKEAWKEVVNEFVRAELGRNDQSRPTAGLQVAVAPPSSSGREPLRVAYNFFAGQGAAAGEIMLLLLELCLIIHFRV